MEIPYRLEQALNKLYTAFHKGSLNPKCCNHCAVGNICDNTDTWKHLTNEHGSMALNQLGRLNELFNRRINGYLPSELITVEAIFLSACGYKMPFRRSDKSVDPKDKEAQFNGLCAVVAYLCELDGVDNVMKITQLFEYEKEQPAFDLKFN